MDFTKHQDRIKFEVAGINFGSIVHYKVFKDLDVPNGETPSYTVIIKRRLGFDGALEEIDFYESTGLDITITRTGEKTQYIGNRIISITEELESDNHVYQTIVTRGTKRKYVNV